MEDDGKLLKTIAVILGIFGMVCSLVSFLGGFLIMSPLNKLKLPPWTGLMVTFVILLSLLKGLAHALLINGALKDNYHQIKIWITMDNVMTFFITIFFGCYIHMMLTMVTSFLLLGLTFLYYTIIWIVFVNYYKRECHYSSQEHLVENIDEI